MTSVVIGAPSDERGAEHKVREAFAEVVYPARVVVENLLPRHLSLPEIHLYLGASHEGEKRVGEAVIHNADHLARLASTVEQLAALNRAKELLTITLKPEAPAAQEPATAPEPAATAEAAETQSAASDPPEPALPLPANPARRPSKTRPP